MEFALPRPRRVPSLLGIASLAFAVLLAPTTHAQQVTTPDGTVTIDYGVLDALGSSQSKASAVSQPAADQAAGGPSYGFPQATGGPQPAAGPIQTGQIQAAPQIGQLLNPPAQNPVSGLTVPLPAGAAPSVPSAAAGSPARSTASNATSSGAGTNGVSPTAPAVVPPAQQTKAATASTPDTGTAANPSTSSEGSAPSADASGGSGSAATGIAPPPPAESAGASTAVGIAPPPPESSPGGAAASDQATAASGPVPPPPPQPPGGGNSSADSSGATSGAPSTQTAAVPPATAMEGQLRIVFAADSSDIPDKVKAELDTLAQKLNADENLRVQLLAYASGAADQASQARRISLSRALAVRSYLIKQGVRSTRMDVRALGNNVKDSPQDRVDIISRAQ